MPGSDWMERKKGEYFVQARQTAEAMYELVAEGYYEERSPGVFTRTDRPQDKRAEH
jgi:hypothetical protein